MKLIRYATLLTVAVALAMGSVAADKRVCGDGSDVTPTLTPAPTPTTEAPTPTPTTQTPGPTPPPKVLTFENSATGKSLVVALPVAEGVCYTFYPCLGGFATAMKWDASLWANFKLDRSIVYFFKTERCDGELYLMGLNEPIAFPGDRFPEAKSVLFRTDPSVEAAAFDPSFITSHSSCE